MYLNGIGIIFSGGRGIAAFENALIQGRAELTECDVPRTGQKVLCHMVRPEVLEEKSLLKKIRRADKFSRMAVLAAADAVSDCADKWQGGRIGIILSTAFGAHQSTFDFLDGIIDYGEAQVSPTLFSNSVHNAAASYIALTLNITGPTLTVTRFSFPFQSALQLAHAWLLDGRCDAVLVGVAETSGEVMRYLYDTKLGNARDGIVRPFNFGPRAFPVPGEGSVFFLVSCEPSESAYCRIDKISFKDCGQAGMTDPIEPPVTEAADVEVIDSDGTVDYSGLLATLQDLSSITGYSPLCGSIPTGAAFNSAASALMLRNQWKYAAPVLENPHELNLLVQGGPSPIDLIRCVGYNGKSAEAVISLRKIRR